MLEVIRKEGNKIVLYNHTGKGKPLGVFEFGEGKDYKTEETARAAAEKRERQIQFFKHQASDRRTMAQRVSERHHSTSWHHCWSNVQTHYSPSSAAAICTWSLGRTGNIYAAANCSKEAIIELTIDDALVIDDVLAAEMELKGAKAIRIDTDTWRIIEVLEDGSEMNSDSPLSNESWIPVAPYASVLSSLGVIDSDRHTMHEAALIKGAVLLLKDFGLPVSSPDEFAASLQIVVESETDPVPPRMVSEAFTHKAHIDDRGNLSGIVLIAGRSANGNVYPPASFLSAIEAFRNQPIFADHPTKSEETDHPERSIYKLVGRLPMESSCFSVQTLGPEYGAHTGRQALLYSGGRLSATAEWLGTLIKEGIAGDMSINAAVRGSFIERPTAESAELGVQIGDFVVESFVSGPDVPNSLDFVTRAAAGGRGFVTESARASSQPSTPTITALNLADLARLRPDIVDAIGTRERAKAYGEKELLTQTREALRMANISVTGANTATMRANAQLVLARRDAFTSRAKLIVDESLVNSQLPPAAQIRVRKLMEAAISKLVIEQVGANDAPPVPEPAGELAPEGAGLKPGDPPTVELPPDAAALPEDAQRLYLETYTSELPKGDKRAVNLAWAAVYAAGWVQNESEEWYNESKPPETPDQPQAVDNSGTPVDQTASVMASFRHNLLEAIHSEQDYLTALGSGSVRGMGTSITDAAGTTQPAQPGQVAANLTEAFASMGLTKEAAEVAARGRN